MIGTGNRFGLIGVLAGSMLLIASMLPIMNLVTPDAKAAAAYAMIGLIATLAVTTILVAVLTWRSARNA